MTKYEQLLDEYESDCKVNEESMPIDGLYCDGYAWINKGLTDSEKLCILAEELGHHFTSYGNILNLNEIENAKQEHKARVWAYNKLIKLEDVIEGIKKGYTEIYDLAEYLGVSELFLKEYFEHIGVL